MPLLSEVVQICLFCSFKLRDVSFENKDFQQAFNDDIVTALANDLATFNGVSTLAAGVVTV